MQFDNDQLRLFMACSGGSWVSVCSLTELAFELEGLEAYGGGF